MQTLANTAENQAYPIIVPQRSHYIAFEDCLEIEICQRAHNPHIHQFNFLYPFPAQPLGDI